MVFFFLCPYTNEGEIWNGKVDLELTFTQYFTFTGAACCPMG